MPEDKKLKLRQLKSKNKRTKSKYIQLSQNNIGRKRALVTFTVKKHINSQSQLLCIKKIKNYFSKRLQNLKADVQYFNIIELGKNYNNPHLHSQLFFNEEDAKRVEQAYIKTIEHFSLNSKRCKLVKESEEVLHSSSYNYIIKEIDNLQLTNKEILDLDSAQKKLKQGTTKHLQFFSMSRSKYPHPLYRTLWFKYRLNYKAVNTLMSGYATRLQGLKLMKARRNMNFPYIIFKGGAIEVDCVKIYNQTYNLTLLTLFYMYSYIYLSSEKCIYNNKRNNTIFYLLKKENYRKIIKSRIGLSFIEVKTLYTVIIV